MAEKSAANPAPVHDAFARQLLGSERLRASVLSWFFGLLLAVFLVASALRPELFDEMLHGQFDRRWYVLVLAGALSWELAVGARIGQHLARGTHPREALRYATALVEISMPTGALAYTAGIVPPLYALGLPPLLGYGVFILLSTLRLDPRLCLFSGVVAAAEYFALYLSFRGEAAGPGMDPVFLAPTQHVTKSIILAASGVAAAFVASRLRRQIEATVASVAERHHAIEVLGQHVSPVVAARLLARGDLTPETRHACVMFLDIRGFTPFAEARPPIEVVSYLNDLLGLAAERIDAHGGIVNKFLGDGIMALFGAPLPAADGPSRAVLAARDVLSAVEHAVAAGRLPTTRLGIGIHAGEVVTGSVGAPHRREYTVIGDTVNLAARVEALNKELGSQLLVTDEVWRELRPEEQRRIDHHTLPVRGRQAPVLVHRLV